MILALVLFLIIRPFNRAKEASAGGEGSDEIKDQIKEVMTDSGKKGPQGPAADD